ncbi:MAG: hypothetical protein RMJ88_13665 [Thermogemmata sp.]|nr:hypothetical protein [Thermogemmata sp.]
MATALAVQTSRHIRQQALATSRTLASLKDEPFYLQGSSRRQMTLTAIAPTQSSSTILGQVSEGIEPLVANMAVKDKQKVKYTCANPQLLAVLSVKRLDTPDVLESILKHDGSVQHLDELTDHEKAVFKTVRAISPFAIVRQAAARQPYAC